VLGGAGALGRGGLTYARRVTTSAPGDLAQAHAFRSRPDLSPPRLQMALARAGSAPGSYYLLTPNYGRARSGAGQPGLMIVDRRGEVIWFLPLTQLASNLRVQHYRNRPVLTWWQGTLTSSGHGVGEAVICDSTYQVIARIKGANGLRPDVHELAITADDTALVTAYAPVTTDLSGVGGPPSATVYDGVVQEIDIASGRLLFEWHSIEHVGVGETYATPPTSPFDYFHINSIAVDPTDANLVVSARNTWAVYKVHRTSGRVLWRLGGKKSDFAMGGGTPFAWQHHVTPLADGTLTVFDDGAFPPVEPQSRALHLAVDEKSRSVSLIHAFEHPARLLAQNQGSIQLLPGGGAVVGWGSEPYFSEYAANGGLVVDGRFPTNGQSYRAFRARWVGSPTARPAIAIEPDDSGGYTIYASWNGATEVASWQALSGDSAVDLSPVGSVPKAGFETAMTVHPAGKYVAMAALDRDGNRLGVSAPSAL